MLCLAQRCGFARWLGVASRGSTFGTLPLMPGVESRHPAACRGTPGGGAACRRLAPRRVAPQSSPSRRGAPSIPRTCAPRLGAVWPWHPSEGDGELASGLFDGPLVSTHQQRTHGGGRGALRATRGAQMGRGTDRIATAQAIWQGCGLSVPRCEHAAAVRIYSALQLLDNGARRYFLSGGCKYTKAVAQPFRRAAIAFQLLARQPTTANRVAAVNALAGYRRALASTVGHCSI